MPDDGGLLSNATLLDNFWYFHQFCCLLFCDCTFCRLVVQSQNHSYRFNALRCELNQNKHYSTYEFWHVFLLGRLLFQKSTFNLLLLTSPAGLFLRSWDERSWLSSGLIENSFLNPLKLSDFQQ